MIKVNKAKRIRFKLHQRNKSLLPRLFVHITEKHAYAALADKTDHGKTVISLSTKNDLFKSYKDFKSYNKIGARYLGIEIGKLALEKGIKNVYFDRGSRKYHGRVKEIAEGARQSLEF